VVSGGGLVESTNYSLRVTVGGSPMGTGSSTNYSGAVGVGALVNQ